MSVIIDLVLPIFALVALGYHAGRARILSNTMAKGLSRFVTHYALPALLFSAMSKAKIPETIEWGFIASFYMAALAVFGLGIVLWMRKLPRPADLASVGLAGSFSNMGALGVPLIIGAYGTAGTVPVMLLLLFQSPLLITTATLFVEVRRASRAKLAESILSVLRGTFLSPMILGIIIGLAVNLLQIPVPSTVANTTRMLGEALLPCSSFVIGASLALGPITGNLIHAAGLTALKTVLHPLLTWFLATSVFMLPPDWLAPAVTAASLPIGMNAFLFAERYQAGEGIVSMSLLMSTVFSPLTISLAFILTAQ